MGRTARRFSGLLLALAAAWGRPAMAETLRVVDYAVTSSSAWETMPRLGKDDVSDLVVFTRSDVLADGSLGKGDLYYQRLAGSAPFGAAVQVTAGTQDNQLDDISGDYIVYTAYDAAGLMSGQIMVYQVSTTILHGLGSAPVIQEPRIHGNVVVWRQGGANATMTMLYDLAWLGTARDASILAGPTPPTVDVDIGDRFVAWAEYSGGQEDVVLYDLATGVRVNLTYTPELETQPATDGPWVVWQEQAKGSASTRILARNMDTGDMRVIADGSVDGSGNYSPSIDGDLVAFESNRNGPRDVFVHRLSTRETFRVTSGGIDHYLNDLFGSSITYVDQRTGTEDVYVADLTFVPDVTVSPASYDFGAVVAYTQTSTCVNLTNVGTTPVSVTPTLSTGATPPFSIDLLPPADPAGYPIAPGDAFCVPLVFAPTEPLALWATTLSVTSGSPSIVVATVPIEGQGIAGFGELEVAPASLSLGDVELGSSATGIVTISNASPHWSSEVAVDLLSGSSSAFSYSCVAPTVCTCSNGVCQLEVGPLATADLEVAFAPLAVGSATATLAFNTTDQTNQAWLVSLTGAGVDTPTPSERVADLLAFFDASVAGGALVGSGPGNSAAGRLDALRNMIRAAGDLIAQGQYARACEQLLDAYRRVDGLGQPPDFAAGAAAGELRARIGELRASIGCT